MCAGIIPARAGFTLSNKRAGRGFEDHPRSRGVYLLPVRGFLIGIGASPLARGLPTLTLTILLCPRIIPARAGFTVIEVAVHLVSADHPRSRGVYRPHVQALSDREGSSPLARGLLALVIHVDDPGRIIPARAGFTDADIRRAYRGGDHPRSRGVYTHKEILGPRLQGSSPLARGLRP